MAKGESKAEAQTREFLQPLLADGETLLAFTIGQIRGATAKYYYIGLTENRIILLPYKRKKPNGEPLSILLTSIQEIKMRGRSIKINLISDATAIFIRGMQWRKRAKELATKAASIKNSSGQLSKQPSPEDILAQTEDFYELGLIKTAQSFLNQPSSESFYLTTNPLHPTLQNKISEKLYALRAACTIIWLTVLISIISIFIITNALSEPGIGLSIVAIFAGLALPITIDGLITYNLWRGHTQGGWVTWALLRTGLGAAFNGIQFISEGFYFDFVAQLALAASVFLVLTGKPSRKRTQIGFAIYFVGFLGMTMLSFFLS